MSNLYDNFDIEKYPLVTEYTSDSGARWYDKDTIFYAHSNIIVFYLQLEKEQIIHRHDGPACVKKDGAVMFFFMKEQFVKEEDYWMKVLSTEKTY